MGYRISQEERSKRVDNTKAVKRCFGGQAVTLNCF